jgi:hypothetical protein
VVPASLRRWFVVHFALDLLFALPLFFAPRAFLGLLGFETVYVVATRLVAAALFGIGVQSLLGRHGSADSFRTMLELKMIWSGTATVGLVWSALDGGPPATWLFVAVFAGFNALWTTWRRRLGPGRAAPSPGGG